MKKGSKKSSSVNNNEMLLKPKDKLRLKSKLKPKDFYKRNKLRRPNSKDRNS